MEINDDQKYSCFSKKACHKLYVHPEGISQMSDRAIFRPDLPEAVVAGDGLLGKLLASLSVEMRESLLSEARMRDVPAGTVVIEDGTHVGEIGYVIEGTLAMTQVIDEHRKHIVGLLVPTDIFGRVFDGPSMYRIEALSDTRVLTFPRARFEATLRQNPETERMFLVHLIDEMEAAREWLLLISGRKVINRVAAFLTILARRATTDRHAHPLRLKLPFSRRDLAKYLGMRPESLSRAFHELDTKGIVRIIDPYCFEISDQDALSDISGDDLTIGIESPTRAKG